MFGKYVDTPVGKIGIYQQEGSTNGIGTVTRSYIHKDHLGSVIATSDSSANLTYYSYDAWGNRRDPDDWSPFSQSEIGNLQSSMSTDRGFTGHEQLDHLNLVHMNGRIYDPVIGRMISPDPLIQEPNNLQSFNRYSYVWNNPLSKTDPSGFIASGLELILGSARYAGGRCDVGAVAGGDDVGSVTISVIPLDAEWEIIEVISDGGDVSVGIFGRFGGGAANDAAVADLMTGYGSIGGFESSMSSQNGSGKGVNGLGTGGGRASFFSKNLRTTGDTADEKGSGVISGKLQKKNKNEGNAAQSGDGKAANGSVTDAQAKANGDKTKNAITGTGIAAGVVQTAQGGSLGTWIGKNGKVYSTGWGGNQYAGGRIKFAGKMAGRAKFLGGLAAVINIGGSAFEGYNSFRERDFSGVAQSGIDAGAGAATFMGPFGFAFSSGYGVGQIIDDALGLSEVNGEFYGDLIYKADMFFSGRDW